MLVAHLTLNVDVDVIEARKKQGKRQTNTG